MPHVIFAISRFLNSVRCKLLCSEMGSEEGTFISHTEVCILAVGSDDSASS